MMFKGKVIAGLQILSHMRNVGEKVVLADVAEDVCISNSYAEQLFSVLSKAGMVKGVRGPGGGYSLIMADTGTPLFEDAQLIDFAEAFYPDDNNDVLSGGVFTDIVLDEVIMSNDV